MREGIDMSANIESLVLNWAEQKGILSAGTVEGQLRKLREELRELEYAVETDDMDEIVDAIGDIKVVLAILAAMYGVSANGCYASAYAVIATRTGKMENGVFVKDE